MKYLLTAIGVLCFLVSFSQSKILIRIIGEKPPQFSKSLLTNGQMRLTTNSPAVDAIFSKYTFQDFETAFPLARQFDHPAAARVSQIFRLVMERGQAEEILEELSKSGHFDSVYQDNDPVTLLVPSDFSIQGDAFQFRCGGYSGFHPVLTVRAGVVEKEFRFGHSSEFSLIFW